MIKTLDRPVAPIKIDMDAFWTKVAAGPQATPDTPIIQPNFEDRYSYYNPPEIDWEYLAQHGALSSQNINYDLQASSNADGIRIYSDYLAPAISYTAPQPEPTVQCINNIAIKEAFYRDKNN